MQRICVFCGSAAGTSPAYAEAARQFGRALAGRGLGLVFGGGHVGLMGTVADAALAAGAEVIGVLPRALQAREAGHQGLTQLHVVAGMHERKAMMAELSDAFVALPGGLGTLEELFEVWTWAMLGFHRKPVCLLDVDGYWGPLLAMVERMVDRGFVIAAHRRMLIVDDRVDALLDQIADYQPPTVPRWIGDGET
ncbi:TIGR00730 family Rossman fold protein [Enhygromyxa salina]|nr:TIGR00730 family Rossman fold protein [Enhygromyxa salina]